MKVIGFNFIKIQGEKNSFQKKLGAINTNINFLELQKEEFSMLKEEEALRLTFRFTVSYDSEKDKKSEKNNENDETVSKVELEGLIFLSLTKEESKELLKSWKKKELSTSAKIPIFNLILKKCTPKALQLEDELGLPSHIPYPQVKVEKKQE